MMRVILLERVRNLGTIGQEVTVKDGYGRNYLLPKSKALRATEANKELFAKKKVEYESRNSDKKSIAERQAEALRGFVLEIVAAAQANGKLYGSITVRDLAYHLSEKGQTIQRGHIAMPKPITETGIYTIKILPHPEVTAEITVVVGATQEELNTLQKKETEAAPEELQKEEDQLSVTKKPVKKSKKEKSEPVESE